MASVLDRAEVREAAQVEDRSVQASGSWGHARPLLCHPPVSKVNIFSDNITLSEN